jgi:hypothetical protein
MIRLLRAHYRLLRARFEKWSAQTALDHALDSHKPEWMVQMVYLEAARAETAHADALESLQHARAGV